MLKTEKRQLRKKYFKTKERRNVEISLGIFDNGQLIFDVHGDVYDDKLLKEFISKINKKYTTKYDIIVDNRIVISFKTIIPKTQQIKKDILNLLHKKEGE